MFDKKTIENFWYYYKAHVIIGTIVLAILVSLSMQFIFREEADLVVGYFSHRPLLDEEQTSLENALSNIIDDVNGDGKSIVKINFAVGGFGDNGEVEYITQQKTLVEISDGDSSLYICTNNALEFIRQNEDVVERFEQLAHPNKIGLYGSDFYLAQKSLYLRHADNEKAKLRYQNAQKAYDYITSN